MNFICTVPMEKICTLNDHCNDHCDEDNNLALFQFLIGTKNMTAVSGEGRACMPVGLEA